MAEAHPRMRAYVKNHGLGLEVPYRYQAESRTYVPDFIVLVDDGRGEEDLLHLVVEIKGFRGEDAKEKADTMRTYWVPGVNGLRTYSRWNFVEFGDVYTMQADFAAKVEAEFARLVEGVVAASECGVKPRTRTATGSEGGEHVHVSDLPRWGKS